MTKNNYEFELNISETRIEELREMAINKVETIEDYDNLDQELCEIMEELTEDEGMVFAMFFRDAMLEEMGMVEGAFD